MHHPLSRIETALLLTLKGKCSLEHSTPPIPRIPWARVLAESPRELRYAAGRQHVACEDRVLACVGPAALERGRTPARTDFMGS